MHQSDHRALIIDFDVRAVLDDHDVELLPLPYRRLRSTIPKRVTTYSKKMEEGWFLHNVSEKIDQLEEHFSFYGVSGEAIDKLNKLDLEIQCIMNVSEKSCCKVGRQDDVFYSRKLSKAIKTERLIKCSLRRESMENSFKYTTSKIKKMLVELKQARREKRAAKKNDLTFREQHLNECAEQFSRDHPAVSVKNAVKQLKHIEKQKREASKIRFALKGRRNGALNYVLIPSPESYAEEIKTQPDFDHLDMKFIWPRVQIANGKDVLNWDLINEKNEVERLTLACMRCHFAQSQGTPFTDDFWIKEFSKKETQESVLNGTYDLTAFSEPVQLYLKALCRPKEFRKELSFTYSFEDFCAFIRGADEKTSASPSGRHYGHYKVLLRNCSRILYDIYIE